MKVNYSIGIVILMVAIVSCENPQKKLVVGLKTEAIEMHDEVMPRMGELVNLGGELKKLREQVVDSLDSTGVERAELTEKIAALDVAHEGMMEWMANYEPAYEDQHPMDSAVIYYERQRTAILHVKEAIEKSIEDATEIINEAKPGL